MNGVGTSVFIFVVPNGETLVPPLRKGVCPA